MEDTFNFLSETANLKTCVKNTDKILALLAIQFNKVCSQTSIAGGYRYFPVIKRINQTGWANSRKVVTVLGSRLEFSARIDVRTLQKGEKAPFRGRKQETR